MIPHHAIVALVLLVACRSADRDPRWTPVSAGVTLAAMAEPAGVELPAHAFFQKLTDRGPLVGDGVLPSWSGMPAGTILGSDPWIGREDGRWWIYYTHGPGPVGSGPSIFRRSADSIAGRYSIAEPTLVPTTPREGPRPRGRWWGLHDLVGMETFTATRLPDESWLALYHGYAGNAPPGAGRHNHLYAAVAPSLAGAWTKLGPAAAQALPWEQGWLERHVEGGRERWTERGMISEPSVIWDPRLRMLVALYSALSQHPDGWAWRTGMMLSPAPWSGRSWLKWPDPILTPPGRGHLPGTINMVSHVALLVDPRGGYHAFTARGGRVDLGPGSGRGIHHDFSLDLITWYANPNSPLLEPSTDGPRSGHNGGPAPVLDLAAGRLHLIYHAQPKTSPTGTRDRHLRYASTEIR